MRRGDLGLTWDGSTSRGAFIQLEITKSDRRREIHAPSMSAWRAPGSHKARSGRAAMTIDTRWDSRRRSDLWELEWMTPAEVDRSPGQARISPPHRPSPRPARDGVEARASAAPASPGAGPSSFWTGASGARPWGSCRAGDPCTTRAVHSSWASRSRWLKSDSSR